MKRYIKSSRERYTGKFDYWHAGQEASDSVVEVLGPAVGGMNVFYIHLSNSDGRNYEGYYVGKVPASENTNLFGEFSWDIKEVLGVDANDFRSDDAIIQAVKDVFMDIIDEPMNQHLFRYLGIDPLREKWRIGPSAFLHIGGYCYLTSWDIERGEPYFVPEDKYIHKILDDNNGRVDKSFHIPKYVLDRVRSVRYARNREKRAKNK